MRLPTLDARLQAVADWVRPGGVVADIGCDHGQLICYLLASGKTPRGYACDIHAMPLQQAQKTASRFALTDRITFVRTDGLHGLPGHQLDTLVMAGMGGDLIARILTDVPWTRQPGRQYLLQPMTKPHALRQVLDAAGFAIVRERAVASGRFLYPVLEAAYTGQPACGDALYWYIGKMDPRREQDAVYLRRQQRLLGIKAEGQCKVAAAQDEGMRLTRLAGQIGAILDGTAPQPFLQGQKGE